MKLNNMLGGLVLLGVAACLVPQASADTVADFYRGKSLTFVIGSGQAGVYDIGGRLVARHLVRFIPGPPATLVPQNMPGASSVRAATYIYSVAPRDGTVFGTAQPTIVLNKLLDPTAKYEPEKYTWIGRLQPMTLVGIAWKAAPHHTIDDAKKKQLIVGASGTSGTSAIVPWALNRMAGTHFKVVPGYQSQTPQLLAMERGELEGVGSASLSDILVKDDWIKNDKVNFLYTISTRRSPQLPNVPAIVEFAENDLDRAVLQVLGSITDIGFSVMAPPDTPPEHTQILRKAFSEMVKDPEFRADATKLGLEPDPQTGEELQRAVGDTLNATGDVLDKLREVSQPPR